MVDIIERSGLQEIMFEDELQGINGGIDWNGVGAAIATTAGGCIGAKVGASIGAKIGTAAAPGIGTVIGGIVGGAFGYALYTFWD